MGTPNMTRIHGFGLGKRFEQIQLWDETAMIHYIIEQFLIICDSVLIIEK
jgi:hypothetical protein